jgi:hypothetical protein
MSISRDGKWLYFTNSAQENFGRVAISEHGEKVGGVEVLASVGAVCQRITQITQVILKLYSMSMSRV